MKLTFWVLITICLPLLMSGQVEAQHSGPYVGAFFGGGVLAPAKSSDELGNFRLTFKPNMLGSAVIGWDFEPGNPVGEGRIELEYTRRGNQLDKVKFVEGSFAGGGTVTADSLLVNFFGVYHDAASFSPYAGFGAGAARIEASNLQVTGQPLSSGSSVVFAYQAGVGIDCTLTNYLNLDLGYRFLGSVRPTFTQTSGKKLSMDYISHNVILGLRLGF